MLSFRCILKYSWKKWYCFWDLLQGDMGVSVGENTDGTRLAIRIDY